jgi:vanillate/4-hydroxybenzoate decarboxylase subunit D
MSVEDDGTIPGVWTVFGCHTCHYVWRSTEPEQNTNPANILRSFA